MEKRVFGCSQFSDIIFRTSLTIIENILDYILDDMDTTHYSRQADDPKKIYRLGFYASESRHNLIIMVEAFENDKVYQDRFQEVVSD